jgi:hypothetical protein
MLRPVAKRTQQSADLHGVTLVPSDQHWYTSLQWHWQRQGQCSADVIHRASCAMCARPAALV